MSDRHTWHDHNWGGRSSKLPHLPKYTGIGRTGGNHRRGSGSASFAIVSLAAACVGFPLLILVGIVGFIIHGYVA